MPRAILVLILVALIIYAAIDCIMSDAAKVRSVPKGAWLAIIILIPVMGALLWLFLGRPAGETPQQQAPKRPAAPDDDSDFLKNLDTQRRQEAKEAELKAKEAELRNRERRLNEDGKDSK